MAERTTKHEIWHEARRISYELIRTRRKTVGITVYRDGRVRVRAPLRATAEDVAVVVRHKAGWIVQKQGQFAAHPRPPVLHYAAGETHYYLGQPYTLHVSQGRPQGATLDGRLLRLSVSDVNEEARRRQVLIEWYRARARELFPARLEACYAAAAQHSLPYPALKIRLLKARWGSCASTGFITLNLRLVQVPLQLIDYVIYHELAHLRVPAHNKAFYALLGELLPDWRARRTALNQFPAA